MTRLPDPLREHITSAIDELEPGAELTHVRRVGGGCINNGACIETRGGSRFFLKWNPQAPAGLFAAEADGLRALAEAASSTPTDAGIRVPRPIAWDDATTAPAWLLLEYVAPGPPASGSAERLGRGLAAIHAALPRRASVGWHRDNWIGSLPQENPATRSWAVFWRDHRIVPQLELARESGHLRDDSLDRLVATIPAALSGVDGSALLHGDLWAGNAFVDVGGGPVLVDPAVYVGDGEVDLAMTELFGGFDVAFYRSYEDRRPISMEYRAYRRELYQLYYLLVHVNLFGHAYVAGALRAAKRVVATVG